MKPLRLAAILTLFFGVSALKSSAHAGHAGHVHRVDVAWYGYLPAYILGQAMPLLPGQ